MNNFIQKSRHILYRLKTQLFYESRFAVWMNRRIWMEPADGKVTEIYHEAQDILPYFKFDELEDVLARVKLRNFTERYAKEPNVIYEASGDFIVEPEFGLAIQRGRHLIRQSGTLSHPSLKPGLVKYLIHYYFVRKYTFYPTLILCDGFAGQNLCHFIYDTINPILFMHQKRMLTDDIPILVSEKIFQKPFFQYLLKNTVMGALPWKQQGRNEWIKTKRFQKPFVSMEIFKSTYKILEGPKRPYRKIFLNRKSNFQRNIKNIGAITEILKKYEFELIFAEELSYENQVKLFREVKWFVGIHGAGLTNLLHAEIPDLRVLEIFSESLVHASFYRFLKILNVQYYDAIVGDAFDINWNYAVDESNFESKIIKLLGDQG